MRFDSPTIVSHPLYPPITAAYHQDEAARISALKSAVGLDPAQRNRIRTRAEGLAAAARAQGSAGALEQFLTAYKLSSPEGIALLSLAEAVLRIPDNATRDRLIQDKLGGVDWSRSPEDASALLAGSRWVIRLTGRLLAGNDSGSADPGSKLRHRLAQIGAPAVREAVTQAVRVIGRQFVMAEGIDTALASVNPNTRYTFDVLGEAARSRADAEQYMARYLEAIGKVGAAANRAGPVAGSGVSVKLSALHPRFELAQLARLRRELLPRLLRLAQEARAHDIALTIDAEEADRLELTLELFAALGAERALGDWEGLGLAVQAYQTRALPVLTLLEDLARQHRRRLQVRLVKGAYWDGEIRAAQVRGLSGYPVLTRKPNTDLSYLACARRLLNASGWLAPQFATHNALTAAAVLEMAGERAPIEFQRLHGMGQALHDQILATTGVPSRIYAPVGSQDALLPYLIRRLLENGASASFLNRQHDARIPLAMLLSDPLDQAGGSHQRIPLPRALFEPDRKNSSGIDLGETESIARLAASVTMALAAPWTASPILGGRPVGGCERSVHSPADRRLEIGRVRDASPEHIEQAFRRATAAFPIWDRTPVAERAACLERAADALEKNLGRLVALACREGGRTVPDGIAEVREAADFCRYYAARAREAFAPRDLPGPTGERNRLSLHGRGVFACISPWNFPIAIFTGQVVAALVAGNSVIAKPAEQTPLTAALVAALLHDAGVPGEVLQLLTGDGPSVGAPLIADPRICGVAFTGSIETARAINRALAMREGPIVPLIAETGGQNAMILDSSALLEQAIADIVTSAFQSAGQRCSALRVLFVPESIAERLERMLGGAMAELRIGASWDLATDVGPVIDAEALEHLRLHCNRLELEGRLIYRCALPPDLPPGNYVAPAVFDVPDIDAIGGEVFGPVLHLIRYLPGAMDQIIRAINGTGFGLTFGVQSRIEPTIRQVTEQVRAGNLYVNRTIIGAVVGVQPFGGDGLSGTGPKAGGPNYLQRFATERTLSIYEAAMGGNLALLNLESGVADTDSVG